MPRRLRGIGGAGLVLALTGLAAEQVAAPASPHWVLPGEVLVLYSARWPDEDQNGRSDSADVAEYYAARRGIPPRNLLGLELDGGGAKPRTLSYAEFFEHVLVPTRRRVAELARAGVRIHYLVTSYGIPLTVRTGLDGRAGEHPVWDKTTHDASTRALTGWLVNLEENFEAGVDPATGKPGPPGGRRAEPGAPPLGARRGQIVFGAVHTLLARTDGSRSFRVVRDELPPDRTAYLVVHLGGDTVEISRGLVDKALYGERYLQSYAGQPDHPYYGRVWLDHHPGRDAGHRPSLVAAALWFQGLLPTSVFAPANRAQPWYRGQPWDVRTDNGEQEIGSTVGDAARLHRATAEATIERVDVESRAVTLAIPRGKRPPDPAPAAYFAAGEAVESDGGARTTIVALLSENRVRLASVAGFKAGDALRWRQEGGFPLRDVAFYYGYYSLRRYHDVYQFRVGAVGSHMDSGSIVWARAALRRGITATAGAIAEPASGGLPQMGGTFAALTAGHDVAEAFCAAIPLNARWNTVVFGDPLYAPFRAAGKLPDVTSPVIERVRLSPLPDAGGERSVRVEAELGGTEPEERDDVALWQVEYGPTPAYGQVIPYMEWPDPEDRTFREDRRYFYTRRFRIEVNGLRPGAEYHFRVSARDPFGHVGVATARVVTPP